MRSPLFELSSRHRGERSRSTLGDGTKMQVRLLAGEELIILLRLFPSFFSTTSLLSRLLLMFFPTGLVGYFGTTRRQPQTPPTRLPRAASRPRSDPAIQKSSPLACSQSQRGRPISRSARWGGWHLRRCGSTGWHGVGATATWSRSWRSMDARTGESRTGIGPGVCDGFTIRLFRNCESCFGEGARRDVSIDDVVLGCDGTEP